LLLRYHQIMRAAGEGSLDQGIAITLRWTALLGLGLLLASLGASVITLPVLLGLGGLWNLLLSINWLRGKVSHRQEILALASDFLLAVALFYFSRTLLGPLVWAGLLPVASAAWAFGLGGGLGAALGLTVGFAALSAIDFPLAEIPMQMLTPAIIFVAAGVAFGFVGRQVQLRLKQGADLAGGLREESEHRQRERTQLLYQVTSALNSSLVFDQVLESALDLAINALTEPDESVSHAVGGILLFGEGGLRLAAGRRLAAKDIGRVLPGKEGALATLVRDGETLTLAQPSQDPEFSHISGLQNCQSLYCTPLRFGLDLFGILFFGHPQADFFNTERAELLEVIARQVMVALQNAQLYETLNEEKERIVHIQEQARKQLARNLHDGPTQSVAAIAMRVNLARRMLAKDPAAASDELYKLEDLARRTTKEIRHMLFTLRPQALESSGLVAALGDLAHQVEESYEQKIQVEAEPDAVARMDLGRQGVLFYIAAEAVSNARRHAQAKNITVRLSKPERDVVMLQVDDDGAGFTAQEERAKRDNEGALGLDTLRERVELINGVMRLDSQAGRGTQLRVWAPLNEQAAERLRQGK
jgi:signal transduction histidine kinase